MRVGTRFQFFKSPADMSTQLTSRVSLAGQMCLGFGYTTKMHSVPKTTRMHIVTRDTEYLPKTRQTPTNRMRCILTLPTFFPFPPMSRSSQLLVVGALRDPIGGNVYPRRWADHFYIAVPNSPHKPTALICRQSALFAWKQVVWSSSSPSSQTEATGSPLWTVTNCSIHVTSPCHGEEGVLPG